MVENGFHRVLTEGVDSPADAFDLIGRDVHHDRAEPGRVEPAVVWEGPNNLEVFPSEGFRLLESTARVAEGPPGV